MYLLEMYFSTALTLSIIIGLQQYHVMVFQNKFMQKGSVDQISLFPFFVLFMILASA